MSSSPAWFKRFLLKRSRKRAARIAKADPGRGLALFAAAAKRGDAESAFIVAEHYLEGHATPRNTGAAARWYQLAAKAGHVRAQCRLAALYLLGVREAASEAHEQLFSEAWVDGPEFAGAAPWAKRAAEAGDAEAQAIYGYILSSGPEHMRDPEAAAKWYCKSSEQNCPQGRLGYALALLARGSDRTEDAYRELLHAAEAGLPAARYLLGAAAERGAGTKQDEEGARQHYRIAAEAGLPLAQLAVGIMLLEGRGGPADPLAGESWLRRAALNGNADAAAKLGEMYARGGDLPPNYVEAANWLRKAAEGDHKEAARALGTLYLTGAGVSQDPDEAASWFKRAAEAGDASAQASLAALMQTGTASAITTEPPPVHEWFERAAQEGDLVGAYNFAVCLVEGVGVARNEQRAAFWLRRAAEGVVNAQYWYGRLLSEGRGVPRDEKEAVLWFRRAAEAGMPEAQLALGELFAVGRGVPRDHELARKWLLLAAEKGRGSSMFPLVKPRNSGQKAGGSAEEARQSLAEAPGKEDPMAALMSARFSRLDLSRQRDGEDVGRRAARAIGAQDK